MPDVAEPMTEHATEKKKKKHLPPPRPGPRGGRDDRLRRRPRPAAEALRHRGVRHPHRVDGRDALRLPEDHHLPEVRPRVPGQLARRGRGRIRATGRKMPLYGYCCPNCRLSGARSTDLNPVPKNSTGRPRAGAQAALPHPRARSAATSSSSSSPRSRRRSTSPRTTSSARWASAARRSPSTAASCSSPRSLAYPADALDENGQPLYPRPDDPLDLWRPRYMYSNVVWDSNPLAEELLRAVARRRASRRTTRAGSRSSARARSRLLADRRIVWDNDQQPKELAGRVQALVSRWPARREAGEVLPWNGNDEQQPTAFRHDKPRARLDPLPPPRDAVEDHGRGPRWTICPRPTSPALANQPPTFIDNFLGYNAGRDLDPATGRVERRDRTGYDKLWVGDLILECEATFDAGSKVVLELSKGVNRFQAEFDGGQGDARAASAPGGSRVQAAVAAVQDRRGRARPPLRQRRLPAVGVGGRQARSTSAPTATTRRRRPSRKPRSRTPKGNPDMNPEGWTQTNDVLAPASIGAHGRRRRAEHQAPSRHLLHAAEPGPDRPRQGGHLLRPARPLPVPGRQQRPELRQPQVGRGPGATDARQGGVRVLAGPTVGHPNRIGFIK